MKFSTALFSAALVLCALPAAAATMGSSTPPTCPGDQPVWVNTSSKAYHVATDPLYGKTKHGTYMCKAAADTAGDHMAGAKSSKGAGTSSMTGTSGNGAVMGGTAAGSGPTTGTSAAPSASASPSGKHHHHKSGAMASPAPSPSAT